MPDDFQITGLMFPAPALAFFRPPFLLIGETTFFTDIKGLAVFLCLFNHLVLVKLFHPQKWAMPVMIPHLPGVTVNAEHPVNLAVL